MWSASVTLIIFVQVIMLSTAARKLRYVKPTTDHPTESCPGQPCLTLGQYMETADSYFTMGTTFVFLPGNHSLLTTLSLTDVSDILLRGIGNGSTASIFLGRSGTILCDSVSRVHVEGLTLVLCRNHCEYNASIHLLHSNAVTISSSTFQGSRTDAQRSVYTWHSNITVLNCFFEGNSGNFGGAIQSLVDSMVTITGTTFTRNRSQGSGGAIYIRYGTIVLEGIPGNFFLHNTASDDGGAICCDGCTLKLTGTNTFGENGGSQIDGGAIYVYGKLQFASDVIFSSNKARRGGAVFAQYSEVSCNSTSTVVLDSNTAAEYGGGMYILTSLVQISWCEVNFANNHAMRGGGGIYISEYATGDSVVISANFSNNSAHVEGGGAVLIRNNKNVELISTNFTNNSRNAVYIYYSTVAFKTTRLLNNTGNLGGAIYSVNSILSFEGNTTFHGNTAQSGGAMYLLQGTAFFDGVATFTHNSAKRDGGALYMGAGTIIHLQETTRFIYNCAQNGGAVYLRGGSFIKVGLNMIFDSSFNTALDYGGGIYHDDNPDPNQCSYDENTWYSEALHCSMQFDSGDITGRVKYSTSQINMSITSHYDSAGKDGSFLYGGLLGRCQLYDLLYREVLTMYQLLLDRGILTVTVRDNETHAITSKPLALCSCDDPSNSQNYTGSRSIVVHRGQTFTVPLVAIAQGNSITSTSVTAITSPTASLKLLQNPQHLPRHCSNLTYNIYSTMENEEVILYPEGPCHDTGNARVVLNLTLLPCPDGFILASDGRCVCEERLREYNLSCTIDEDIYVTRKAGSEFWIGAEYANESYEGLILYETCPIEYCRTGEVNMTLHDLDTQCARGRIGVLCGGCAENCSLLIGSSKCKECSNTYLVLILPFAAAGVALVGFLSVLRLTVATGMINSLILYANVVQVNKKVFFPPNTVNILTVFIAWLNLDLGFETCFYDGMDAFAQTCLQFAFPVYIWVLISLIILTSRYSITVSKLIGHNPIAVLATLLLMSYTKVLKIIIEAYSSVKLDYPQNKTVTVWLKDANVPYLQSKHLALTVMTSLVLLFLFLPYTLLLLLGYKVYRFSGRKRLHWLNKMKPLLDSYYAPYKSHTRYWTGFLLLVRCALYIVFSFNSLGATQESLLAIIITFTALAFAVGYVKVYNYKCVNILEASIYLNLVTISAFVQVAHQTALVIVYSFVGIVFTTTIGIIVFHFHVLYTARSATWLKLRTRVSGWLQNPATTAEHGPPMAAIATSSHDPHKIVSTTVIELREPLLEDSKQ